MNDKSVPADANRSRMPLVETDQSIHRHRQIVARDLMPVKLATRIEDTTYASITGNKVVEGDFHRANLCCRCLLVLD